VTNGHSIAAHAISWDNRSAWESCLRLQGYHLS